MMKNFHLFRAEVRKQLDLRNWKYRDLATAVGCSVHYINSIMNGGRYSDKIVEKIVDILRIPKHLAT